MSAQPYRALWEAVGGWLMHWVEQLTPPPPAFTHPWKQVNADTQAGSLSHSIRWGQHFDAMHDRQACGVEVQATGEPPHVPLLQLPLQHSHCVAH